MEFWTILNTKWASKTSVDYGLTLQLHTDAVGYRLDALGPECLVKAGVKADVLRAHSALGEGHDGLDGGGCALLEGASMHKLVQVNGVLADDNVLKCGARLAAGLCEYVWGQRETERDYGVQGPLSSLSTVGV